MDKYMVSEIPSNQQVVIDVPEGYLRVAGYVDDETGDGKMVFTRALERATTGLAVPHGSDNIPLMQMHVQSSRRALVIAHAFMKLAEEMMKYEEGYVDEYSDDDCGQYECEDCPSYDMCYGDDHDMDDDYDEEFGNG